MENKKKLSIICFSGDFDKLVAAYTLGTGSAAMNYEVNIFFTFWGLNAIKKNIIYYLSTKDTVIINVNVIYSYIQFHSSTMS